MKEIGLLSDTHGFMDDRILHHLSGCDEIWHAGDIGSFSVMEPLHKISTVRAVYGNIDDAEMRGAYPLDCTFEVENAKCYITHIAGRPGRYPARVKSKVKEFEPDIFVCGHSHLLLVQRNPQTGLIHLNPGAAGKHGFHKMRTLLRFSIDHGKVENLRVVELGKRGG
jgi:putative phosphoesterase